MSNRPDTTASVSVYLTDSELGAAFANRDDESQVRILREMVGAFDNSMQAEMQAFHIGKRLFAESSQTGTMDVISFLRMILESCSENAEKVRAASALPAERGK